MRSIPTTLHSVTSLLWYAALADEPGIAAQVIDSDYCWQEPAPVRLRTAGRIHTAANRYICASRQHTEVICNALPGFLPDQFLCEPVDRAVRINDLRRRQPHGAARGTAHSDPRHVGGVLSEIVNEQTVGQPLDGDRPADPDRPQRIGGHALTAQRVVQQDDRHGT
jgi:hypothetical protein